MLRRLNRLHQQITTNSLYHHNNKHSSRNLPKSTKPPTRHSLKQQSYQSLIFLILLWTLLPASEASSIYRGSTSSTSLQNSHNVSRSRVANRILSSKPAWHDPCGTKHRFKELHRRKVPSIFMQIQQPNDDDLMHGIINMAKMALRQSRYFKEDYVSSISFDILVAVDFFFTSPHVFISVSFFKGPSWFHNRLNFKDFRYKTSY